MSPRFEDDEETRNASGYGDATYKAIFETLEPEQNKVARKSTTPTSMSGHRFGKNIQG